MLRKLALSLAVAGALVSTQANALGLGDIKIKSALNEPLNAEIQLHQIRDLNPLQIRPRMADQDEFALAGMSQQRALSDIRFQVKVSPNGSGVIILTSRDPVKEPFINFLVEVNWPSGRLVREYTLLLDPPVFDPAPTQRLIEPAVSAAVDARSSVQAAAPVARNTSGVSNIRTRMDRKSQTYVDVKDTLWGLAIENRVAPDVSSYQMMVAMYKKNPQAFLDGNINNLKAGVVLNLPTEAEARAVSSQDAAVEVHRQTALWKQRKSPVTDKAPIDGTKKSLKSDAAASEEADEADKGQLKVVTPAESVDKDDAALKDQNNQVDDPEKQTLIEKNELLENQLAVSSESLERLERDNVDLNDKLDAIQQQLDSLQRLIELKDQQLAALQNEVNKQPAVPVEPPPPVVEKSLLDKILQTPEYLAGIGGGLIAALVGLWLMIRRKKKTEEAAEEEEFFAPVVDAKPEPKTAEVDDVSDELADVVAEETSQEANDNLEASDFDLDDLDDLNLDMDLDLDESFDNDLENISIDEVAKSPVEEVIEESDEDDLLGSILDEQNEIEDDEFDLGLDELAEMESPDESALDVSDHKDSSGLDEEFELDDFADDELETDTALDELLADDSDELDALEKSRGANERSGMGMVDPISDLSESEDTLESLGLGQLEEDHPVSAEDDLPDAVEEVASAADDEGLEFNVAEIEPSEPNQEATELDADLDGLDFDLDELDDESPSAVNEVAGNEDDLDFETDLMADLDSLLEDDVVTADETPADLSLNEAEEVLAPEKPEAEELDLADELDVGESVEVAAAESEETLEELAEVDDEVAALLEDPVELDLDVETADEPEEETMDLAGFDLDDLDLEGEESELPGTPSDEEVTRELTSNIEHDLDAELDGELEALLNSTDNDIALEETSSEEEHSLDALGFLDGADEVETKLDLARAYIDMDDVEGARDILEEIAQEGNGAQKEEAKELLEGLA